MVPTCIRQTPESTPFHTRRLSNIHPRLTCPHHPNTLAEPESTSNNRALRSTPAVAASARRSPPGPAARFILYVNHTNLPFPPNPFVLLLLAVGIAHKSHKERRRASHRHRARCLNSSAFA